EDGRIIVVKTGTLTLRTADVFDSGLYHCIGTNYNDADTVTFRITVVEPYVEDNSVNGARLSTFVGSTLYLPCTSTAVPDAAISWALPERVILHHSVRNKQIFDNGTLRIQGVTERDNGYFRCVAANLYGVDLLVFQVTVRKDETTRKEKQAAVGEWEEGHGSGDTTLGSAAAQKHPLATPAALTANREPAASTPRNWAHRRNSFRKMTYRRYRDKTNRRFRGHRRQFVSSARRVDPQRWAALLEKTKRNSTLIEKQGIVATKPPIQVPKFSEVPGGEEETSGDLVSPEEEFMMPVTETAAVFTLGSTITAALERTASNALVRKTSLLVEEAVTPLPSPFSQPVSSDSRQPQTYINPTITNSWERSGLSQTSAEGMKNSTLSNGASRTSTLFPVGQSLVYSEESNNQHLTSASTISMTDVTDSSKSVTSQNTMGKLHAFTESANEISTKADDQVSVGTVSDPSPEYGHIYLHSTQKQVTPKPASTTITHQQMQNIQDVITRTAQAQQQYGRQRKVSGRRRIVTPGRIPSIKEHRYNFGRPGSTRGSTAVAAGVQLNVKFESNLPSLNNIRSSINPFSPEAPLASPSTTDMPLEHPEGTHQNTALLREEKNKASARQNAATALMPLITEGTQATPQWKSETNAPFQITDSDRVQPFGMGKPTRAFHTADVTTETTHPISTKKSSTLQSVSPSIKPITSAKSQRGNITREQLFGNTAQKEVLLQKQPKQQIDLFLSTEVSTMLPKTTAALSMPKMPPLHFTPITGGTHSSGFWSLNKPIHHGSGKPEEHLLTTKPHSYSNHVTGATKAMDVTSVKPMLTPIITPQSDTKITKSKIFRVGRKRGQRKRRPPKTSALQSVTASYSTAAIPSENTATPVAKTVKSLTMPANPLSESASTGSVTEMPALWTLHTPEAPQHVLTAATPTFMAPFTQRNIQPDTRIASSLTTPGQTTPLLSMPSSTTSTQLALVSATSGSEPAQQITATSVAGEKPHLKMEERVTQENHFAQPPFPDRTRSSTRAPAESTDTSPPSTQHSTPLP
ncbi:IGS10 protein, partial [Ceuthmochares aereus]|nr:IGS10 protein [Ceuthmochares aereus]